VTPILGVIADDLTGGMEVAAMLVGKGARVAFVTDVSELDAIGDVEAVVVARKIRTVEPDVAVADAGGAAQAFLAMGVRQIFFKYCATFDSTDRGNIGPVADRLADMTGAETTLFCPSYPEVGRTVYQGHLFVSDQLVSDSPKRFDPLTPMTDPRLVDVLQRQSRRRVGLLDYASVRAGHAGIGSRLADLHSRGIQHVIADAILADDLAALAEATADWPLLTGNSSIAEYLPQAWERRRWCRLLDKAAEPAPVSGGGVVLSGSCAERTLQQLAEFEASHPVLWIDLESVDDVAKTVGDARSWAAERKSAGPFAIATSASTERVAAIQARLGRREAAMLAETILGRLAVELRSLGVRRFLVAGGETSGVVVESLGIRRLAVGSFRAPGIALAATPGADPLALCLKSGKLGAVDMLASTLQLMAGNATGEKVIDGEHV
jgi:3-dehydrotetronate 4-kinase